MVADPIADMLIRIKNALAVGRPTVELPYSKIKLEIARILKEAGYLQAVEKHGRKNKKLIELALAYHPAGNPKLSGLTRVSKSSRRIYKKAGELWRVKQGLGLALVSTSKGLMTDGQARRQHLGGEIICEVW